MRAALLLISALLGLQSVVAQTWLTLEPSQQPQWFSTDGLIQAVNQGTMSAQTSGRVKQILVDVNDLVENGALLIVLDDARQQAGVKQAQAQVKVTLAALTDAKATLKRHESLFKQGTLSVDQLDSSRARAKQAAAQVEASKAALKDAKEALSYTRIKAPYSGIVSKRLVEVGESVNPGMPLITGLSLADLRTEVQIPQRILSQSGISPAVKITTDSGEALEIKKQNLFPFADDKSHSFTLRLDLQPASSVLFPGMWVKVKVALKGQPRLWVPQSAILKRTELNAVYIKNQQGIQLRQIVLGRQMDQQVEVLSGLQTGDVIAADALGVLAQQSKNAEVQP